MTRITSAPWPYASVLLALLSYPALPAAPVDAFNVVWDSPSKNHHGSMPLGNGDVALNAWMTADGDLHCYLSKTDAWDDNARLVKIGKVRVHFEPNPVAGAQAFRQELRLDEGCIEIRLGDPASGTGSCWTPILATACGSSAAKLSWP